jgi:threonine dehydratase
LYPQSDPGRRKRSSGFADEEEYCCLRIADGLRTNLGAPNFALIQRYVDDIVTVSDEAIVAAMRTIWETLKIVVEPSGAVPYAAVLEGRVDLRGRRVGLVLTGGNVDLDALPWMAK